MHPGVRGSRSDMRRSIAFALLTLALACGGATQGPAVVKNPGDSAAKKAPPDEIAAPEPAPKPCADGTCVECGEGVCPTGFYCEHGKGGATGCAWVAPCADKPTCGCVAPHVKGCACEDKAGVAFVSCT